MGLISRATKSGSGTGNYAPNTTAKSSEVNVDVNSLYTEFNGNIDNANIKTAAAIAASKIDLSTISQNMYINGEVRINGTLTAAALNLTGATLVLNSLQLTTSTVITGIFDEDAMTSNSASAVPTQQSVKAYVDGKFNTSTGHDHDGSDSKKVVYTDLLMTGITDQHYLYNNSGTPAGKVLPTYGLSFVQSVTWNTQSASVTFTNAAYNVFVVRGMWGTADTQDWYIRFATDTGSNYYQKTFIDYSAHSANGASKDKIYFADDGEVCLVIHMFPAQNDASNMVFFGHGSQVTDAGLSKIISIAGYYDGSTPTTIQFIGNNASGTYSGYIKHYTYGIA